MDCTALAQPFSSLTTQQRDLLCADYALLSLVQAFRTLPDPRSRHGLRYELPFLLTCLVAALLCNCNHSEAVGQWCQGQRAQLERLFGTRRFLCPTGALYRWLLPQLDVNALETLLWCWVRATVTMTSSEPIALDGKMVRGARTPDQTAPHLLSFRTHDGQETLLQIRVEDKTNEIPIAQTVLPLLVEAGRIYTADALHTQVKWMQVIEEHHAFTVLTVKDNQPTLLADLHTYFADPSACCASAHTWDRHRGRVEHRSIRVTCEMNAYLHATWPHIHQVAQVTRVVTSKHGTTTEIVSLITNLSPTHADPERLLRVIRGHWSIENGSHSVRDVTFGEDRSRLRSGDAPQIMATLRNLAITFIHRTGSSRIAETRRTFSYNPAQALDLLFRSWLPLQ